MPSSPIACARAGASSGQPGRSSNLSVLANITDFLCLGAACNRIDRMLLFIPFVAASRENRHSLFRAMLLRRPVPDLGDVPATVSREKKKGSGAGPTPSFWFSVREPGGRPLEDDPLSIVRYFASAC